MFEMLVGGDECQVKYLCGCSEKVIGEITVWKVY